MKTLKILAASILLVSGMTVKSFAGASDFAGLYIGVSGAAVGAAMDGKHTDGDANAVVTKGTAGAVSMTAGGEVGFSFALSDTAFVSISANYNPVDAEFKADDAANANDVTLTFDDIVEVSIEPSFSVSDNSAFYVKAGYSEFSVDAKGTGLDATQSFDITGESIGMGTKTITDGGIYIKTEVGMTNYDGFTLVNVGTDDGTATINDIQTAYGKIMIGKKF
tara:strand:+ start:689 stop:1351 length:663 start_codon:yes stop_codon:yes gene_type:complete